MLQCLLQLWLTGERLPVQFPVRILRLDYFAARDTNDKRSFALLRPLEFLGVNSSVDISMEFGLSGHCRWDWNGRRGV
jgi:hypothetical protein